MLQRNIIRTAALLAAASWLTVAAADTYYVNGACGNDAWTGTSPTCQAPDGPKATIQAGVNAALGDYDVVVVYPGTYTGVGNRDITFNDNPITLQSLNCDPNEVIMDCWNQGRGFLFINDETTDWLLCGFTILNGYASGTAAPGGGIKCGQPGFPPFGPYSGSPSISNCVIRDCHAVLGGGLSCTDGSSPMIYTTSFIDCTMGGMIGSTPFGGAVYALESSPEFMGCRFHNNGPSGSLGGSGGAVYLEASASLFSECTFAGNYAPATGGAVCAYLADPDFDYCTFYENGAGTQGGAIYCTSQFCESLARNCTFYGNTALSGGTIAAINYAHPSLERCIVALGGEVAYCQNYSSVTITCCDIWGNASLGCVAGQMGSSFNFSEYPGFCDPFDPDYALTLRSESPCAAATSPCGQQVGAWDVDCSGPMTYTVCPDGSARFTKIQDALHAAFNYDTVELCDATYNGDGNRDLDCAGKSLHVRSASDDPNACVIACGGDPNTPHRGFAFTSGEDPNCIVQGVRIHNGYADWPGGGAVLCSAGSSPTLLNCLFDDNHTGAEGGAVHCRENAAPTLRQCVLKNNTSDGIGGGMLCGHNVSFTIDQCRFEMNLAGDHGGGIGAFSTLTVTDTDFIANDTFVDGGGVACMSGGPTTFTRCQFTHNLASNPSYGNGAGVSSWTGDVDFHWCTFTENSVFDSGGAGGAVWTSGGLTDFENCTLYANAASSGGGVYTGGGTLDHTIIAYGTVGEALLGPATLTCCDIYANAAGPGTAGPQIGISGNISMDPLFCGPALDLTLDCSSPCLPFRPPNAQCDLIGAWDHGCDYCTGDMNCDCLIDFADINPFVMALTDPAGYAGAFPDCDMLNGDLDGDGECDFADINPFVVLLTSNTLPMPCP